MREVHNVEDRLLEDLSYPEESSGGRGSAPVLARTSGYLLLWTIAGVVCYAAAL